ISSWPPASRVPLMETLFTAMKANGVPLPDTRPPLSEPSDFEAELGAAGFGDIRVEEVLNVLTAPSLDAFWGTMTRSMAPLVFMRRTMGEDRWAQLAAGIHRALLERFGAGPQRIEQPAWVGVGVRRS